MGMDAGIGEALANVPIGALITNVALGIAEGQMALDIESLRAAQLMSGHDPAAPAGEAPDESVLVRFRNAAGETEMLSMMELGFTPAFYQFIDTLIEVKIAITVTRNSDSVVKNKGTQTTVSMSNRRYGWWSSSSNLTVRSTPVDATYTNKYGYTAEGSSLVRTKLVPIPPPAVLEERIRSVFEASATAAEED